MRSLPVIRPMSSIPMSASTAALAKMAVLPALSRLNNFVQKGRGAGNAPLSFIFPQNPLTRSFGRGNSFRYAADVHRTVCHRLVRRGRQGDRRLFCVSKRNSGTYYNYFREQGFPALRDTICTHRAYTSYLRLIVIRKREECVGDNETWLYAAHPSRNLFCEAKEIREHIIITSASRVSLRCGTQFVPYVALIVLRMTDACAGDKEIKTHAARPSRNFFCMGKRNL